MPFNRHLILPLIIASLTVSACSFGGKDEPLQVIRTLPADGESLAANGAIRVQFDRYLDPKSIKSGEISLSSGDASASFRVGYDPVDRALVIQPRLQMRVGLQYTVSMNPDVIRGLNGSSLISAHTASFRVTPAESDNDERGPVHFNRDLIPIIENRCGCHGPEPMAFPELTPEALVDRQSQRQSARTLVTSGRPLESYLIHRILPDYPQTRGETKDLTDEERRLFVRWVTELPNSGGR